MVFYNEIANLHLYFDGFIIFASRNVYFLMIIKHTKPTLQKLEEIFRDLNYNVRYEKGTFNSGYCIVEDKKVVVVNKFYDTDSRVHVLFTILETIIENENQLNEKYRHFYKNLVKNQMAVYRQQNIKD